MRVEHLFRNVAGLKLPTKTWRGLDVGAVTMLLAVASGLLFFNVALLNPQTRTLVRARDVLCAGDVDFVVTKDGIGAFSWSYLTQSTREVPRSSPPWTSPSLAYPIVATSPRACGARRASTRECNSGYGCAWYTEAVLLCEHGRCAAPPARAWLLPERVRPRHVLRSTQRSGTPWPKDDRPDRCEAKNVVVPSVGAGASRSRSSRKRR